MSSMKNRPRPRGFSRFRLILAALGLAACGAMFLFLPGRTVIAGPVALSLADLTAGKAAHFEYQVPGGPMIRYFIVRDGDRIRAAFDACETCWPAGLGYTQEGSAMVCNNCGRRFPLSEIGKVHGGCNPHPLKTKLAEGRITIADDDILEGRRFFENAGGGR